MEGSTSHIIISYYDMTGAKHLWSRCGSVGGVGCRLMIKWLAVKFLKCPWARHSPLNSSKWGCGVLFFRFERIFVSPFFVLHENTLRLQMFLNSIKTCIFHLFSPKPVYLRLKDMEPHRSRSDCALQHGGAHPLCSCQHRWHSPGAGDERRLLYGPQSQVSAPLRG